MAAIEGTEQAAFSDILVDPGGIVRRGLLFLDDGINIYNSFAFRLASIYLKNEGAPIQPDPAHPQFIRINNVTIKPLEANDGGYVKADARGYQFLLDYLAADDPFEHTAWRVFFPARCLRGNCRPNCSGWHQRRKRERLFSHSSQSKFQSRAANGRYCFTRQYNKSVTCDLALADQKPITFMTTEQESLWLFFWSLIGRSRWLKN